MYIYIFCAKWYQRLEEFSLILMNDIIEYSEKVKQETLERANSELDKFRTSMRAEDYKEVCDTLHQNSTDRKQTLLLAKRKKFNYLKYHRGTPMQKRNFGNNDQWKPHDRTRVEGNNDENNRNPENSGWRNNNNSMRGNQVNNKSYKEALTGKNNDYPSQRNSRTTLYPRNNWENTSRQNSGTSLNNRNARTNLSEKDNEINDLRKRLATLEGKQNKDPKNELSSATSGGTNQTRTKPQGPNAEQVLTFIATTMATLEEFKKHFETM